MNAVTRDELMGAFERLQAQFEEQKSDIHAKDRTFNLLRQEFISSNLEHTQALLGAVSSDNPLHKLAQGLSQRLADQFEVWQKQVKARVKGAEFRENVNDSLLVFVYGKVKSGKSSLGNYVAWGHSEPTAQLKAQAKVQPVYFSAEQTAVEGGDKHKEAEQNLQFRVGATEATSSIQGFRLPGLTWVDSPGLHSVNRANGDLAREYVEHADLILYTMSSQAPGRASDMGEIGELLADEKSLMVLLTGSDTTEEDEDDDGNAVCEIVMKPAKDRQAQVDYVNNELQRLDDKALKYTRVVPLSTRFAQTRPDALAASGVGELFQTLKAICDSNALQLKLATPMKNLSNAIKDTAADLALVADLANGFEQQIREQGKAIEQEVRNLGLAGAAQMSRYVNQLFDAGYNEKLEGKLRDQLTRVLGDRADDAMKHIDKTQQAGLRRAFDASRLSALPEYREVTVAKEYRTGTESGTKTAWGAGGTLLGGAVGFLVGGIPGALLGASIGSASSLAGRSAKARYETHQVVVGDNLEEQRQAALDAYANAVPALLAEHVMGLYEPVRASMQRYCEVLVTEITRLNDRLDSLVETPQP
ncbi:dynamin [Pseudomonas sp. FSL R10-0056]|uniref:Dynamin n=1 Tax=Pseudomonas helleri TaxID=1608996 RepID=A0A7X2CG71_9PSED|nr:MULTISPECIES: dynamin family protein [Pseudomonas]MQT62393.1 dynamin [Pseudomonas sp. FSL R10-0056]MQT68184.1 dynamin [Pseudomonas sp. FSL R10-0071]MQT94944.1 dynamin [Pseudomonas helleri]MQU30320.1 dynamin [Pseudomonas helleri]MQU47505.1 dynamin [Pseudomonas sp. FSL A6-1183]